MNYLIVIPTYNEVKNIGLLIQQINYLLIGHNFSILIVDDSSNDGTLDVIYELKKQYKNLFLLKRKEKLGLASAYVDGFNYGIDHDYDFFVQMDADFSHNPKYLVEMFEKLKEYDVVIGSRYISGGKVKNWGVVRNFISKGGSLYSRIILGCPISDLTGGFNGWTKNILERIDLSKIISKGYCFQVEMKYRAYKCDAKIVEYPIIFEDRKYGVSKMSIFIFLEAFFNIFKLRFFN